MNRFDGYGDSHLNAVRSSNPRRDGYYIADGAGTRKEISYEQALELAKNNPNIVVNYYKDNVGGTGRLHWDENQNQFVDNNEYFGKELDNVDVVQYVNTPPRNLTDAIPINTPALEYRPDIVAPTDFTNTDQNMFHRRDVARADAAVREALSSDVVNHIYDYMMPSTWAGAVDKLFDHDENGNMKYNFFTDFNKVFNPSYDNQGWVGLVGADEWADEHPEATAAINTGVDLVLPIYVNKAATWLPETRSAWKTFRQEVRPSEVPHFKRNLAIDLLNPNRSVARAINQNRYALNESLMNQQQNKIKAFSENSKNIALDAVGSKLKMSPDLILSPNTVDYLVNDVKRMGKISVDRDY